MVSFTFVGGKRTLKPENILYVQTDGHRNVFTVIEGNKKTELKLYMKLDEIERILAPFGFVRCHRSLLVNMRYVKSISNYLMELSTAEVLTIPRARYRVVKEAFKVKWEGE